MTLPNICRAKEISISRIDLHDVADHLRPEISGEKEKGRPDRSYLVGGGCRTTTWRSRTWSGTKSYRPTPTPAPAEIYSRSPRTIYGEEIARCPSCSLYITVIYNLEDFSDGSGKNKSFQSGKQQTVAVA
ncbi:hypothetical protein SAY86_000130 [Trapa natans]|uniref:Uncharacterized protein n=1 Tax=Trapa natans TaxID=22666 RepID=A0AAN7MBJ1_TRANT|nr:hypothetical protein SAY86_000130 [Trapa natans]